MSRVELAHGRRWFLSFPGIAEQQQNGFEGTTALHSSKGFGLDPAKDS